MKTVMTITRWFVGILFIFSGLVKANDPLGLSYKMQEFFEAWGIVGFHHYTLAMAVVMNAFEIIAGAALIVGWRMKLFGWLILLLILFFGFLTGYAWLATNADGTPKFSSCGCFGDCIPLVPFQSFLKDILLLVMISVILIYQKNIQPIIANRFVNLLIITNVVIVSFAFQFYTLNYLPVVDCLPYQKGNNLLALRKIPADAVPDKFDYVFTYEKEGKKEKFTIKNLPDSTWTFVDRQQILIAKGKNNMAPIKDFDLKTETGEDVTEKILLQPGSYYFLFINNVDKINTDDQWVDRVNELAAKEKVVLVSSMPEKVRNAFRNKYNLLKSTIVSCDVTAIKTAARTNVVLYKMDGAVVVEKCVER